jgi:hypothetical protein
MQMMNKQFWTKTLGFLVALGLNLACAHIAYADSEYIFDPNKVVSSSMKGKLDKLLSELDAKKSLLIEEHILPTLGKEDPLKVVGEFAQKLDSRGSKAEYRALVLYVLDNNFVQIYPNKKLASIIEQTAFVSVADNAKKELQQKKYDEMARISVAGIYHFFQKSGVQQATDSGESNKKAIYNMLFALIVLAVVVGLIKMSTKKSL